MDFTREPIIETIITPREGCKLVIRSSKSTGREEYFVDAVEVVSFGPSLFYRSLERPKAFLAPVTDFEVLEVREARMVLKNTAFDRSIKIGGGRDASPKLSKEKPETPTSDRSSSSESTRSEDSRESPEPANGEEGTTPEVRSDKKRDRRRNYRKRRGRDDKEEGKEEVKEESRENSESSEEEGEPSVVPAIRIDIESESAGENPVPPLSSVLLQPPPMLISETMARYRREFKDAFYLTDEEQYKPHDKVQELLNEDDHDGESSFDGTEDRVSESSITEQEETGLYSENRERVSPETAPEENRREDAALSLFAEEEGMNRGEEMPFPTGYDPLFGERHEDLPPPPPLPQRKASEHSERL